MKTAIIIILLLANIGCKDKPKTYFIDTEVSIHGKHWRQGGNRSIDSPCYIIAETDTIKIQVKNPIIKHSEL